jgi:hypothetical protein
MLDKQHKAKQHETQQNGAEQGLTKRKGEANGDLWATQCPRAPHQCQPCLAACLQQDMNGGTLWAIHLSPWQILPPHHPGMLAMLERTTPNITHRLYVCYATSPPLSTLSHPFPPPHCRPPQDEAFYNQLPEATEDELDMLDLAFGLTDTYVVIHMEGGGGAGWLGGQGRVGGASMQEDGVESSPSDLN